MRKIKETTTTTPPHAISTRHKVCKLKEDGVKSPDRKILPLFNEQDLRQPKYMQRGSIRYPQVREYDEGIISRKC